jgi:hypothetical protein
VTTPDPLGSYGTLIEACARALCGLRYGYEEPTQADLDKARFEMAWVLTHTALPLIRPRILEEAAGLMDRRIDEYLAEYRSAESERRRLDANAGHAAVYYAAQEIRALAAKAEGEGK